ncbi:cupin domain-containing protein [Streptomyces pratensis]|uniref:cupin domain-containing protein n=1 Tax=Streptomyces pratensis TaxID=1169025 RepID=UPI00301819C5
MTSAATKAPSETVTPLFEHPLPDVEGKTFTSVVVRFPPSARAKPHRHGTAFVYAYVLSGTVRSRLDDEPVRTYRRGESWFEAPGAHHVLTENASGTRPAELLVVFVSDTGEPLKTAGSPQARSG